LHSEATGIHGVFGEAPYDTSFLLDDITWLFSVPTLH